MIINIGFGINDEFCQHCACAMASVLRNSDKSDEYNFYIVSEQLSDENINNLEKLKKIRDFNINYIPIDINEFEEISKLSLIDKSAFYRFKLFSLEEPDKILYLDSDVIVRKDIKSLYERDIEKYCIAGAKDIQWKSLKKDYSLSSKSIYINSGVMLINTKRTRKIDLQSKILEFAAKFKDMYYGDQDIINYIFQEKILDFDIKYNYSYPYINEYDDDYYNSRAKDPTIVHYITDEKPWKPGTTVYMKSEYFKYLKYTSYFKYFMPIYQIEENVFIINKLKEIMELAS